MAFRRWFPHSLVKQAQFYIVFLAGFKKIAFALGFTQEDIDALERDVAVMQYLVQMDARLKTYGKAFRELRKQLTTGSNDNQPVYLELLSPDEPPIVPYGMFDRLFYLADRIEAAVNYSPQMGASRGIRLPRAEALRVNELKPVLRLRALIEAQIEVRSVRGATSGVWIYMRRAGSEEVIDLGNYYHSPAIIKIPLLEAGKAEQIEIYGCYVIKNETAGNYSDITTIVVAP